MQKISKKIKVGLLTLSLLSGVSSAALLHGWSSKQFDKFKSKTVVVQQDTLSMLDFYRNAQCIDNRWYYIDAKGNKLSIDSLCDYTKKDSVVHRHYKNIKLKEKTDTVYVSYADKNFRAKNKTKIMYSIGSQDSLPHQPSMGKYSYNTLIVRAFVAENKKLQRIMDIYNDEYNCTRRHEYQHYLNTLAGIRNWNSYSVKYVECCLDEVSANIAQCLAQRNNYLRHGKDLKYITDRFAFYKKAIQNGDITPSSMGISEEENKLIANGVFNAWMKDKYNLYAKINNDRAKLYLRDAPYIATKENKEVHNELMKRFFTIDGYDFWQYISKREEEIFNKITDSQKKEYVTLRQRKHKKMTHLDEMENIKETNGNEFFQDSIRKNWVYAKLLSLAHHSK